METGLVLIIIGIAVALLLNYLLGILVFILGLALVIAPRLRG